MKTAISVPDETFRVVDERAARLGINRSEFYVTAARRYLAELDGEVLTAQIDEALGRGGDAVMAASKDFADRGLAQLAHHTTDDEW